MLSQNEVNNITPRISSNWVNNMQSFMMAFLEKSLVQKES